MTGYEDTEHNRAQAVGGPLNGKELSSRYADVKTLNIPTRCPDGWGMDSYEFKFGMWMWKS